MAASQAPAEEDEETDSRNSQNCTTKFWEFCSEEQVLTELQVVDITSAGCSLGTLHLYHAINRKGCQRCPYSYASGGGLIVGLWFAQEEQDEPETQSHLRHGIGPSALDDTVAS